MSKMYLKNSEGKPSLTTTLFVIGFVVVTLKLLLSGITIYGFKIPEFSGLNFATCITSLGGIYVLRRNTKININK